MKRIALVAAMALLCMCMVGCASNSASSNQSGSTASSSSQAAGSLSSSAASSNTLSVGDEVDVAGSIILVASDSFVVDCTGVHFTCVPADSSSLSYVTAGNTVQIEGTIASIEGEGSITLENVTIDDYSDGYKNFGEHYQHHSEGHHGH